MLEGCGYTVIPAADGEDAFDVFTIHNDRIDLVILDVIMPRMNGKNAYEAIRAIRPDARVIFMSGYTDDIVYR